MDTGSLLNSLREEREIDPAVLAERAGITVEELHAVEQSRHPDGRELAAVLITELGASRTDGDTPSHLDDDDLIARVAGMTIGERLEAGFELAEFSFELAGVAQR